MKTQASLLFLCLTSLLASAQPGAIDSLQKLLARQTFDSAKTKILLQIGDVYIKRHDSALLFYEAALQLTGKTGNKKHEIIARSNMAVHFLYKNENATALDLYLQNIERAKETGVTDRLFADTRDVGLIYNRIGDYQQEYEYQKKLKALFGAGIYMDSNKVLSEVILFNRFAMVYTNQNRFDSARHYARLVLHYGRTHHNSNFLPAGAMRLGEIYTKLNVQDSAFYYYRLVLPASLRARRPDLYYGAASNLGRLFWLQKQVDSAIYYVKQAYDSSDKRVLILSPRLDAAALLADIYHQQRQPDSAYKYLRSYIEMKDSLFNTQELARLQNIGLKNSLQEMQVQQERKEAVKEYTAKVRFYSLLAGLAVLVVLVVVFYMLSRQRKAANHKLEKAFKELKATQQQLVQQEKMASLGELTAGIAHEIQNPLNFVNNFSEVNNELIAELKQEADKGNIPEIKALAGEIEQNEQKIVHHGRRADAIVKNMLQHSQTGRGQREPTDINALVDEYLRLSYHGVKARDKQFAAALDTNFDSGIGKINVVPQDLGRVLLNLFNNAFYAVNEKKKNLNGKYEPMVSVLTRKTDGKVEIEVRDNGTGISPNSVNKIFQPFFTTKPTGEGTGLGLSMSYDIIKTYGGELQVEAKENEGAEFTIVLPLKQNHADDQ
jgi:signal transduction histidine kinase